MNAFSFVQNVLWCFTHQVRIGWGGKYADNFEWLIDVTTLTRLIFLWLEQIIEAIWKGEDALVFLLFLW